MTIDQHARASTARLHTEVDKITVPEIRAVVRRARRRRAIGAVSAVVLVAVVVASFAFVLGADDSVERVEVAGPVDEGLPAGSAVEGRWAMIPKEAAGIGPDAALSTTAQSNGSLLLGGSRRDGAGNGAAIWRSDDGTHWTDVEYPVESGGLTAMAGHDEVALAIGAPGIGRAFVWRSDDGGRRWAEVARGDVFGAPVPDSRPGASVSGLIWYDGWWVAFGGAADGYEGIWISRDGARWSLVLDSRTSGAVGGIARTPDGALMAYGAGNAGDPSAHSVGWFTDDPTSWGKAVPLVTPDRVFLSSVASGAAIAVGGSVDEPGVAAVLRSTDGGHTWTEDVSFRATFPDAWAFTAANADGRDVIVGTTAPWNEPTPPKAWLFSETAGWITLPSTLGGATLPIPAIPQVPPGGSLSLVSSVDGRIVMLGTDTSLDRFYVYDSDGPVAAKAPAGDSDRGLVP